MPFKTHDLDKILKRLEQGQPLSHYELLGISQEAKEKDIRTAAESVIVRIQERQKRLERFMADTDQQKKEAQLLALKELEKQVREAQRILMDAKARQTYDQTLQAKSGPVILSIDMPGDKPHYLVALKPLSEIKNCFLDWFKQNALTEEERASIGKEGGNDLASLMKAKGYDVQERDGVLTIKFPSKEKADEFEKILFNKGYVRKPTDEELKQFKEKLQPTPEGLKKSGEEPQPVVTPAVSAGGGRTP